MNVTRMSPRRSLARIHAAIQGVTGYAYNAGEDAGGGGGSQEPAKGQQQPAAGKPDGDDGKLTLTKAELDAQIAAAVKAQQDKADAKAKKEREDAEAAEAQKRGEFEKVAATEKAKRESAEAENVALKRTAALRDYIGEHKVDFNKPATVAVIAQLIDAAEDDTDKAIKDAVAKYEKSLPEQPKGGAGAQPATPRAGVRGNVGNLPGGRQLPQNNERPARRFSTLTHRA